LALVFVLLIIGGCSSSKPTADIPDANDPKMVQAFEDQLKVIVDDIRKKPDYKRIPLDTKEDQEWFINLAFLFWDGKSTRDEFIAGGIQRFPEHRSSFEFLADELKN